MAGQNGRTSQQTSDALRLNEFVADLAQLRREAGQPSLRKMAETAHYSHTALSSVLSGNRLPSQELTLAFVRACGGDEDAWRARWHRENALMNGREPAAGQPAPTRRRTVRPVLVATAGIAALATVTVIVLTSGFGLFATRGADGPATSPVTSSVAVDGADPQEKNCQLDAVNAHTVQIPDRDPAQQPYGSLTLRHSPRCRAAWPLFVSTERVPTGVTIRLITSRPSDGTIIRFDYPFMVSSQVYSVFGNVLLTTGGCVSVTVEISAPDNRGLLASAQTPCVRLDSGT